MSATSGLAPGAAPFVPGGAAFAAPSSGAAAAAGFKVTAAPFVPSWEATASPPAPPPPAAAAAGAAQALDLRAQPFVPASARATGAAPGAGKGGAGTASSAEPSAGATRRGGQQQQQQGASSPVASPPKSATVALAAGAQQAAAPAVTSPPAGQGAGRGGNRGPASAGGKAGAGQGAAAAESAQAVATTPVRGQRGAAGGNKTHNSSTTNSSAAAASGATGADAPAASEGSPVGGPSLLQANAPVFSVGRGAAGTQPSSSGAAAATGGAGGFTPVMSPAGAGASVGAGRPGGAGAPTPARAPGAGPQASSAGASGGGPALGGSKLPHHHHFASGHHVHPHPFHHQHHHQHHHHAPGRAAIMGRQFVDDKLRRQLSAAAYAVHAQWSGSSLKEELSGAPGGVMHIPDRVSTYHSLLPLDHPGALAPPTSPHANEAFSLALGVRAHVFKAVSSVDGKAYALRRIDGKQVMPTADALASALQAVEVWSPLCTHPHLVGLKAAFISADVDAASALFFAYDFHPGCVTLAAAHLTPSLGPGGVVTVQPPSEPLLWSYLVQLACALRSVHAHRLAARPSCLHPSKVLVSPTGRLRINCCGLPDALAGDVLLEHEDLAHAHRMDLTALGQLMLSLACAGLVPPGHVGSLDLLTGTSRVSPELCRLISSLLASAEGGMLNTARQLCHHPAVVDHMMAELDAGASLNDTLMTELSKECENGRLLRVLVKLGFVVERPHGDVDESWAETGDRYLLKLFRDFVFHQRVPEGSPGAGGPLLDWGYVIEALNKLDAGVSERIMLLARDEAAMLIASYADLKRCVETSYADLQQRTKHAVQ